MKTWTCWRRVHWKFEWTGVNKFTRCIPLFQTKYCDVYFTISTELTCDTALLSNASFAYVVQNYNCVVWQWRWMHRSSKFNIGISEEILNIGNHIANKRMPVHGRQQLAVGLFQRIVCDYWNFLYIQKSKRNSEALFMQLWVQLRIIYAQTRYTVDANPKIQRGPAHLDFHHALPFKAA